MSVLKHEVDNGDLSIVAAEDQILIACNRGHYWIIDATMHQSPPPSPGKPRDHPAVLRRFGEPALRALEIVEPE